MTRYDSLVRSNFTVRSQSGDEIVCLCRWCNDKTGHLYVNVRLGVYICFRCHAKGRLDQVFADLPPLTTTDLRDRLARMTAPPQPTRYYPEGWLKQFAVPHPYWTEERGLPKASVDLYGLGYDPVTNRATIPLRDVRGRILGVTYRRLDDGRPKYLHPKSFPIGRHLFGAWLVRERKIALVEGQVDSIWCRANRVPAVSLMGSRITPDQVKVLQRMNVSTAVLMLDNDRAGLLGTIHVYEALQDSGIRVIAGWYRHYWDAYEPDDLTGDRLRKMFHSARPMNEWADLVGAQN